MNAKAMTIEAALGVLAQPDMGSEELLEQAARCVNEGIAAEAGNLQALQDQFSRESLDMMATGRAKEAEQLATAIRSKSQHLFHLRQAAREANRRMKVALAEVEAAAEQKQWAAAMELMKRREDATRKLVALADDLGKAYAEIGALADRIWDALPRKPHSNPDQIDFFAMSAMEQALDQYLHYITGWTFGEKRLGSHPVPDMLAGCFAGHRVLASLKPIAGAGQGLTIDAAEYERRMKRRAA